MATNNTSEPKRLYRDTDNKMIAGVCSGIATYLNIDPVLTRLVAVGLALCGGGGVFFYLIAWLIIPQKPAQ